MTKNKQGVEGANKRAKGQIVATETTVDHITGEVIINKTIKKYDKEPPFVKLYLDCLLVFNDLSKSLNPILLEFLKYMNYSNDPKGPQTIFTNAEMKRQIAATCGKSVKRVDQALAAFVKKQIFFRTAPSTFLVNPYLVGRGEWADIANIRAEFDFAKNSITSEWTFQEVTPVAKKKTLSYAEKDALLKAEKGIAEPIPGQEELNLKAM